MLPARYLKTAHIVIRIQHGGLFWKRKPWAKIFSLQDREIVITTSVNLVRGLENMYFKIRISRIWTGLHPARYSIYNITILTPCRGRNMTQSEENATKCASNLVCKRSLLRHFVYGICNLSCKPQAASLTINQWRAENYFLFSLMGLWDRFELLDNPAGSDSRECIRQLYTSYREKNNRFIAFWPPWIALAMRVTLRHLIFTGSRVTLGARHLYSMLTPWALFARLLRKVWAYPVPVKARGKTLGTVGRDNLPTS